MAERGALGAVRHACGQRAVTDEAIDAAAGERHRLEVGLIICGGAAVHPHHCCGEAVPQQSRYDFVPLQPVGDADVGG